MSAIGSIASGILFAQPVCCAASGQKETLVLHLEWQPRIPDTTSASGVIFKPPEAAGTPAADFSGHLSATAGGCPVPSSSTSSTSTSRTHGSLQEASQQPSWQLQGMLFNGPRRLAHYSWPLPAPVEAKQVLTVAAQLPSMSQPCVLELVLMGPTVDSSNTPGQAAAAQSAAAPPQHPPAAACAPNTTSWSGCSSAGQMPPAVCRCPVVYLPPAAVQEVQQVLLPAMQREVLEGWAGSQAGAAPDGTPVGMPLPLLQAAVWQHWQGLADDLGLVLGLQQRLASDPQLQSQQQQQQQQHQAAINLVVQDVVPNLVSFLLQQGLQQVAAVVQQAAQTIVVSFPPAPQPVAAAAMSSGTRGARHATPATMKRGSGNAARRPGRPPLCPAPVQRQGNSWPGSHGGGACSDSSSSGSITSTLISSSGTASGSQAQVGPGTGAVQEVGCDAGGSSSSYDQVSSHPQQHQQQEEGKPDSAAPSQSLPQLTAATCWSGFPGHLEQQYVQYKHQQYLWLDRYAAWFTLMWICVLLVRIVWEQDPQGIIMYLCYLLGKAAPYTLLISNYAVGRYQRQRELLLSVVSQALCLAPIVLGALLVDPGIALPLIQGASWAIHWCQQHASRLLQCWMLLQARWPQLGVVGSLPGAHQLAAAATTAATAVSRSPTGMLQLHQHLAAAIKVPESPMRSFWRIYGEYQVLVPMAIPRHVRLWCFVPSMLAEVAGNCYVFSWVFPWWQVVLRFTPALLLTIGVAWWFDWYVRGKFVGHVQQLEKQRAQQLAEKLKGLGEDS